MLRAEVPGVPDEVNGSEASEAAGITAQTNNDGQQGHRVSEHSCAFAPSPIGIERNESKS